jgi:hypothetical protein
MTARNAIKKELTEVRRLMRERDRLNGMNLEQKTEALELALEALETLGGGAAAPVGERRWAPEDAAVKDAMDRFVRLLQSRSSHSIKGTQKDLAETLEVSPASFSRAAITLVESKDLTQEGTRNARYTLTERGRELVVRPGEQPRDGRRRAVEMRQAS